MNDCPKITDRNLQSFAGLRDETAAQSIIAELASSETAAPRSFDKAPPRFEKTTRKAAASDLADESRRMDELERELTKISGDLVRLNAAEAFVLNVTPDQLRAVCELGLVGAVRPNRVHRVTQGSSR